MRTWHALLVATFLLPALAGCLSDDDDDGNTGTGDGSSLDPTMADELDWPSGQGARDYIESYVMTHPFRVQQAPYDAGGFMDDARTDLTALLQGMHLDYVMQHEYGGDDPGMNIIGFKNGTVDPHKWVVLSAHYDTVGHGGIGPTVYGAWDDGAGTAVLLELAEKYGSWDFPFTVVFLFTDGEEKGLVGSGQFLQSFGPGTNAQWAGRNIDILANLNTDPPGLNWPCGDVLGDFPVKIIYHDYNTDLTEGFVDVESPRAMLLTDAIEFGLNATGVPENVRDYSNQIPIIGANGEILLGGTSDHRRFGDIGIANVYIGGTPTTFVGGDSPDAYAAAVLTYSFHTPLDTLQQMEARCTGGNGTLADGLQTTVDLYSWSLLYLAMGYATV